jgi:hypothetical protein
VAVPPPPPPDAAIDAPDARPWVEVGGDRSGPHPGEVARGGACQVLPCADGLTCGPLPQGYCMSDCAHCDDGTCVDTWQFGASCLATCTSDRECRADEGYVCDPAWHACMLPNAAAIVPKTCPGVAHEAAFGAPVQLAAGGTAPTAALAADGALVVLYEATPGMIRGALETTGFAPRLARMPTGFAAVWLMGGVMMTTSKDGVAWDEPRAVQDPVDTTTLDAPSLAPGYAMYGVGGVLRIRPLPSGTAITPMAGARASIAVGADKRVHVVSLDGSALGGYGSADQRIEYAVSRDGGRSFAKPLWISARDEELPWFFATPAIAVDDKRGWLYLAYVRGGHDAVWELVVVAMHDKLVKRAVIGDGCAIHMAPALALDGATGTLHVAYYDSSGLSHATCTAGACKVAGSLASFAVSTALSGPRALGDRIALVVDEKRRALHAVWAQPGGVYRATAQLARAR